jgi:hypothetical protein
MAAVLPTLRCAGAPGKGVAVAPASESALHDGGAGATTAPVKRPPDSGTEAGLSDDAAVLGLLREDVRKWLAAGNYRLTVSDFDPALERAAFRIAAGAADLETSRSTLASLVRQLGKTDKEAAKGHPCDPHCKGGAVPCASPCSASDHGEPAAVENAVQGRCATFWPFC